MKVVTSGEMYRLEKESFKKLSLPPLLFMEYAAMKVFKHSMEALSGIKNAKAVVVAGTGNNGGDGLAAARHLHLNNIDVVIILVGGEVKRVGDAAVNLNSAESLSIPIIKYPGECEGTEVARIIKRSDIIIDALLGIGTSRPVAEDYKFIIENINLYGKYIISVDMPSGVSADTGWVLGEAVRANKTVTFSYPKLGLIMYPGAEYAGEVVVEDICISEKTAAGVNVKTEILDNKNISGMLPERKPNSNKGTYGKVFALAGSDGMPGAAVLCVNAAYRTGCGLVRACVTEKTARTIAINATECVASVIPDEGGFLCERSFSELKPLLPAADAIILGPGLGVNAGVKSFVSAVLSEASVPVVIDADALNVLSADSLNEHLNKLVITPHPVEMSRLSGIPLNEILENPLGIAKSFAEEYGVVTVLKGARTVIASPDGTARINITGNSALAKAGSGDVLTGIIAALIAQGMDVFDAAAVGCHIHGKAGEMASEALSEYGVTASDVIGYIPKVIKEIGEN